MRSYAAKKIGQSDYELVLSAFFSFFLHAAIIVIALILYSVSAPKVYIPPFYDVKLVGPPAEVAPAPIAVSAPPVTKKAEPAPAEKKPLSKVRIAAPKPVIKALNKGVMPELAPQKKKTVKNEEAKTASEQVKPATAQQAKPAPKEPTSAPNVSPAAPAASDAKTAGVGPVSPASGNSKQLASYSQIIHDNIERNWVYPPGVKGLKVKVKFRVLRSGRVFGDVNIEEPSGNAYFDIAAKRAILSSSPFPPMPEEFYKQYEEFSVHLAEKE